MSLTLIMYAGLPSSDVNLKFPRSTRMAMSSLLPLTMLLLCHLRMTQLTLRLRRDFGQQCESMRQCSSKGLNGKGMRRCSSKGLKGKGMQPVRVNREYLLLVSRMLVDVEYRLRSRAQEGHHSVREHGRVLDHHLRRRLLTLLEALFDSTKLVKWMFLVL